MTRSYSEKLIQLNQNSSTAIQQGDLKNRFLFPFFPTIIIDNFYDDPDLWREYALEQEFFKGNRGSWPGVRTKLLHEMNEELFDIVCKKIMFVLRPYGFKEFDELQTAFQMIDESYGRGWVHDDDPKLHVAGVVYLNKDAPEGCGTTIYKDAPDFNGEEYTKMFMKDVLDSTPEERKQIAKYREDQLTNFTPEIKVESVYNRFVLFDSRCWHSADNFFGTTKEESRLNQVFFVRLR
jgi:hypothetical protein